MSSILFLEFTRSKNFESKVLKNTLLKEYTTFKIGGPADVVFIPENLQELQLAIKFIYEHKIPVTIFGCGSNILVSDKGIRGVVIIMTEKFSKVDIVGDIISAQAGISVTDLSKLVVENGFAGMEFAVGIPGSVGGAVFMNAGAYGGEFANIVHKVITVNSLGELCEYRPEQLQFGYRHSVFQENRELILQVEFKLATGDKEQLRQIVEELTQKRSSKQPLEMPSAGSVFKRPVGNYAGTLIEQAGLKGKCIGGAQVSEKHAGFIVNKGDATAKDVLDLIEYIREIVWDKFAVRLESEVRFIGEA